ncbi:MAG: cystathionine gamma-synthase [Propionibacterium sp.]|nr:cystathionine gamma-synthase [Propionibacterium sp.]
MTNDAFGTRAVHAGLDPDPATGAVVQPIYWTSTYQQDAPGQLRSGYEYGRAAHPNRTALQTQLASLEGGEHAFAFTSGLAAEDVLLRGLLGPDGRLVVGRDAYGGTLRLFRRVHADWRIDVRVVDLTDHDAVAAALAGAKNAVLWVETPSNPWMTVHDIAALTDIARGTGARVVVDNTFASPVLQQPLALGADVVVHSTTKYLGGHSDVVGGALIVNDPELAETLAFLHNATGAGAAPMDCWLTSRGIKTLQVRMERHCSNARAVAEFLADHPAVSAVHYPGLPDHPGHHIAAQQMSDFGGMVSVQLAGGEAAARTVGAAMRLFVLAESLGGVESLVCHPATMTHASLAGTAEEIPADMLRLSVGIEDVDDLIADLARGLDHLT